MVAELKGVKKNYGAFQLDVTMQLEEGKITGVVGQNGAGKSTTFKAMLGTVVAIVSALVTGNPFDPAEMAFTLECALLLLGFLLAAFLPIQFKYGSDNGRVIMCSVFVVAFLCVFAVGKAAESFGIDLEALLIQLQALGVPVIFAGLAVLLAAASFISWKVSCGILEKKEY